MNDASRTLFRDLQPLAQVTAGKPDPHENLTDVLEIVAVAEGIRRAHLQGQGQHDEGRLAVIERIVHSHGLMTLRTTTLLPFQHRRPRYNPRIIDWEDARQLERQQHGPDVVWVYAHEPTFDMITNVVTGKAGVSHVLSYPECCEFKQSEDNIVVGEAYVQGIIDTHQPATSDALMELWERDVKVPTSVDPDNNIFKGEASLKRFPYVQFTACTPCLADDDSPGARINRTMRDLAFALSFSFGRDIWQTRDLLLNKGRPISVSRNEVCPCGSGAKFKRCCL
jgi:hypothetical protein